MRARARALLVTAGALAALAVAATLLGLRAAERPLDPEPSRRAKQIQRLAVEFAFTEDEARRLLDLCGGSYAWAVVVASQAQALNIDPLTLARPVARA